MSEWKSLPASLAFALLLSSAAGARGEYVPPTYPQTPPAVSAVGIQIQSDARAGSPIRLAYRITPTARIESPRRLFAHFIRDGRVLHVAVFPEDGQALPTKQLDSSGMVELGPFETTLPADLPAGEYTVLGGMYLEPATGQTPVTLSTAPEVAGAAAGSESNASATNAGHRAAPAIIINTGTFIDKAGVPHRWHVNKAHTLYWDGQPFLPVGGMLIPDEKFETFKAQIDLLVKNNVRDVYFNVGNSIHMPHTWETKSDEKLRYFQQCIDYMDEAGVRYGMEFSGLQAKGYAYELMGGKEIRFRVDQHQAEPRMERANDDEWIEKGVFHAAYRRLRDGYYLIEDASTGSVVSSGSVEVVRDERKTREGKDRSPEEQLARVKLPALPAGEYRLMLTVAQFRDGWNMNMHYWSDETAKYYQAIRDLYGKIRMGPGFRFVVDAFWNENNFNHGLVPAEDSFRTAYGKWLKARYGAIEKLHAAWALDDEGAAVVSDFTAAGHCVPLRGIREKTGDEAWDYLINTRSGKLVRARQAVSQHRYDLVENVGRQVRDFHVEIADLIKGIFDVPVTFKFFSGVDFWHINDTGLPGGHDGVGMETYGVAEPMLTFMAIPALSSCRQSTKTMWLVVTEVGEGNHQDQAIARNKLFGCTSRLGTMYSSYASLLSGGAKGIYHYYMVPSPGADRFWDDSTLRDPRQLEWMGTFARMVENAPDLVDYVPTVYYRFPGLLQPNSGLLYSDPYRDFYNTDCLWWVDPAGKLPNGAWLLPTFTLRVPTDMMFINLENTPASLRHADEVSAFLKQDRRVTWLGYRKDLGTIPAIDRYYTREWSTDEDGVEFQVLKPPPDARIIGRNQAGQVWNFITGRLQIISKNAENKTGWRPQRVVLDNQSHRFDYWTFMRDRLGTEPLRLSPDLEGFTFLDHDQRVTVIGLEPRLDEVVRIGEQLPAWGVDATGNPIDPPPMADRAVSFHLPKNSTAMYAGGESIPVPTNGELTVALRPDELALINSEGKIPWAREGLVFNTLNSRAAVIIRSPADAPPAVPMEQYPANTFAFAPSGESSPGSIVVEAERPVESNFNLDVFSGLAGLSGDGLLGLASQMPPPAPDGYTATYTFDVPSGGTYALRVREGYLAMASPGRWRVDEGPWRIASNAYVPEDIRIVAQYNALEDERMIFAWYDYGQVELSAGTHRLTYSVIEKRPGGVDIGLQNSTPYGKLLDCFMFVPVDGKNAAHPPKLNLVFNPSMEQDTGGWTAEEWTPDRWKWFELRDEQGWNRDFWWTKKVGGEGRIFIDKFMDLGGMTVRQSYAGVRALRIRAGEQPRRFSSRPMAVAPGEQIAFGGCIRAETLHAEADLRLRFLDRHGREVSTVSTEPIQGDTHWQHVHHNLVEVPPAAVQAILDCHLSGGKTNLTRFGRNWHDTAWFDELYVHRQ
ncbi:MAG: hypothetical protein AMXMBFR13_21310 [Phycisphaerae bacterium]